jgi:hypothetical protein
MHFGITGRAVLRLLMPAFLTLALFLAGCNGGGPVYVTASYPVSPETRPALPGATIAPPHTPPLTPAELPATNTPAINVPPRSSIAPLVIIPPLPSTNPFTPTTLPPTSETPATPTDLIEPTLSPLPPITFVPPSDAPPVVPATTATLPAAMTSRVVLAQLFTQEY